MGSAAQETGKERVRRATVWELTIGPIKFRCLLVKGEPGSNAVSRVEVWSSGEKWQELGSVSKDPAEILRAIVTRRLNTILEVRDAIEKSGSAL